MLDPLLLHRPVWQALQARRVRLPHAILLAGQRGLGKLELAKTFVSGLLCEQPRDDGRPCGACLACGWQAQGNHPDFRLVQPRALEEPDRETDEAKKKDKPSQAIVIDQVRELDEFLNIGTHRGGLRIVLLYPAEAMNRSAANALLKSLEEPPPDTLFLLISDEPMRLLPTLRSRCQMQTVPLPDAERAAEALRAEGIANAERWLALAGGAPAQAVELAQSGETGWLETLQRHLAAGGGIDALAAAAALDKMFKEAKGRQGLRQVVEWSQKWAIDLSLAQNGIPPRYFLQQGDTMTKLAAEVADVRLMRFCRHLLQCRREVEQPLNTRLFLEEFFLNYRVLFKG